VMYIDWRRSVSVSWRRLTYVGVAKYFHELYTESINITDNDGQCALHIFIQKQQGHDNHDELMQYLLQRLHVNEEDHEELTLLLQDQGTVSTPNFEGDLPLHIACKWHSLCIVISSCMIPTQRPFMY
jgi:hypothetical protein